MRRPGSRQDAGGIIPEISVKTSVPVPALDALFLHALETLSGQPGCRRFGKFGLHALQRSPGGFPLAEFVIAVTHLEQGVRHLARIREARNHDLEIGAAAAINSSNVTTRAETNGADITATEVEPIVYSSDPNFRPSDLEVGGVGRGRSDLEEGIVGFAPADDPALVVVVSIYDPRRGRYGGQLAGPVFADTMKFALPRLGVAPSGTQAPEIETFDGGRGTDTGGHLHLRPRDLLGQQCLGHRLEIDPLPVVLVGPDTEGVGEIVAAALRRHPRINASVEGDQIKAIVAEYTDITERRGPVRIAPVPTARPVRVSAKTCVIA